MSDLGVASTQKQYRPFADAEIVSRKFSISAYLFSLCVRKKRTQGILPLFLNQQFNHVRFFFLPYSDISFVFVVKETFDNCEVDSIRNKDFNFYLISGALHKGCSIQENDF